MLKRRFDMHNCRIATGSATCGVSVSMFDLGLFNPGKVSKKSRHESLQCGLHKLTLTSSDSPF